MALKRALALVVATILLIGATLMGRMLYAAREELAAAEQAAARADEEAVDRHLRRAIAHYAPGNVWVVAAARRLKTRADQAARHGQRALALRRYRALRSALLALRPFGPHEDFLPQIDKEIGALAALQGGSAARPAPQAAPRHDRPRHDAPNAGWTLVGLMGFLLWIGSSFALVAFGFNPDLTLLRGRFWRLLGFAACGLCLFGLGMCMA